MALVVLCGHPASGKSKLAGALADALRAAGREVMVVGEESAALDRNVAYQDSVAEKQARGALKSAVEHAVTRSRVVIFDSLNNIKGYRYELWCIARSCGTRYCMLHCATDAATAAGWNAARAEAGEPAYRPEIFEDLAGRFEAPEPRNRWDSPLFVAHPAGKAQGPSRPRSPQPHTIRDAESSARAVADVVAAVSPSAAAPSGQQGTPAAAALQPTTATSNPALAATNLLAEMDRATQEVVVAVLGSSGASSSGAVELGEGLPRLELPRQMTASELRRHKRDFLRLATKNQSARLRDVEVVKRLFVEYLQDKAAAG
eukprot:jgi/Tetstr1/424218/TSEL_000149.t1